jgi:hypothetical protein
MDTFKMLNAFMTMTDLTSDDDIKAKVKTKERMVFATMRSFNPEWEKPSDWDGLTDEVKLERLELIQKNVL